MQKRVVAFSIKIFQNAISKFFLTNATVTA